MTAIGATKAELRFHLYRLGSRDKVGRLYGVRPGTIYKMLPQLDMDLLRLGRVVKIGNILCKRCSHCGTAREMEHYWANDNKISGLDGWCRSCRGMAQ